MAVNKFLKKRNINNRNKFQQKKKGIHRFQGGLFLFLHFFLEQKRNQQFWTQKKKRKRKRISLAGNDSN